MTDLVPVRRALISVSDKSGLDELAAGLARHGVEMVSTGGTAAKLREAAPRCATSRDLTGFPEMMDGRVKTLHPKVHGGLLAVRDNPEHAAAMAEHGIAPIDLVVVNLYPFLKTVMSGADRDTIIENIDIGGPSMVRSAAKNHAHVAIVTDPADYAALIDELDANGGATTLEFRKRLAAKAFALTAAYDSTISQWFAFADQGERFPQTWTRSSTLKMPLRYGENPHQQAALYVPVGPAARGIAQAEQVQGKELSYNNLNDANAALELVAEFRDAGRPSSSSSTPIPAASPRATRLLDAWSEALACDSVSAFGGIVAGQPAARRRDRRGDHRRSSPRSSSRPMPTRPRKRDLREEEEPAPAADRRAARSGARRPDHRGHRRRDPGPGSRQWHDRRATSSRCVTKRAADRAGNRRLPVRLDRRQARQVERDRLCQGRGRPPASAPAR